MAGTAKQLRISGTGFPGTTKTLKHLQEAFQEPLEELSNLLGDFTILSGVVRTGNVVSDGVVVYDGAICPVIGGTITHQDDWGFVFDWGFETAMYDVQGEGVGTESLLAYENRRFVLVNNISDYEISHTGFNTMVRLKKLKELTDFVNRNERSIIQQASGIIYYDPAVDDPNSLKIAHIPNLGNSNYFVSLTIVNTEPFDEQALHALSQVKVLVAHKSSVSFGVWISNAPNTIGFEVHWVATRVYIHP